MLWRWPLSGQRDALPSIVVFLWPWNKKTKKSEQELVMIHLDSIWEIVGDRLINWQSSILERVQSTVRAIDQKESDKIVYADFKKAFGKISHIDLVENLTNFGIFGCLLAWMIDFPDQKTQEVRLDGTLSLQMQCVVRDTSEQCLRTATINQLLCCIQNCQILLFGNDCMILKSFPKLYSDYSSIHNDLDYISDFCHEVQMQISVNECQVLTFNGGTNDKDFVFHLSGNKIPVVQVVRDLGTYHW